MVIERMMSEKSNLFWTFVHVFLGYICTLSSIPLIIWFYFVFFTNINKSILLLKKNNGVFIITTFSYLISMELLDRMAKTSPFIPHELSKYFLIILSILGLFILGIKSTRGVLMFIILIPSLFYDFSGKVSNTLIIYNLLGPIAVGLCLAFSNELKISTKSFDNILKLIWWTSLSCLIFTIVKTPDLESIDFQLSANFSTTAGHASNQVSTVLGLGMFLSFYSLNFKLNYSGNRILDLFFLLLFTFQGLLSFSRGGMMVGAAGIVILLILDSLNRGGNSSGQFKKIIFVGFTSITIVLVFQVANSITDGKLLLRYQGETQGTLLGSKELNIDNFTTGRVGILEKDMDLFFRYPITGVGAGASMFLRDTERSIASHVEFSRLFAEHGILGLLYAFLFFTLPVRSYLVNRNSQFFNRTIVILLIAILTTFHAAMRTYVTPLFIVIGMLKISNRS